MWRPLRRANHPKKARDRREIGATEMLGRDRYRAGARPAGVEERLGQLERVVVDLAQAEPGRLGAVRVSEWPGVEIP